VSSHVNDSQFIPIDYYYGKKNQNLVYEPEFNKKNVFLRKANRAIPVP
jgi:hypothetical protein